MPPLLEKLACVIQALLPQRALTALVYRVMRIRQRWIKNLQIRWISRWVGVDWSEACQGDPEDYPHFNAFFTRRLKPGIRQFDADPAILCSPVDGRMSESGPIREARVYQAKGRDYRLQALLAEGEVGAWSNGYFATIYLSPRDYHRIHMPLSGRLSAMTYVPGKLYSVAPYTVRQVDALFARNERLVCHFETDYGPMALILVGAMLVAGMETTWAGPVTPPRGHEIQRTRYPDRVIELDKGEEMGRFNMGSTVILVMPDGMIREPRFPGPGGSVRLGQPLAELNLSAPRDSISR